MAAMGWKRLLADGREFRRPGRFPIAAYSEFMPPPRLVRKPYGTEEPGPYAADDPSGWQVSEYEEALQLRPGLEHLAAELIHAMEHLGNGRPAHGISRARLADNPFWPPELADRAGTLAARAIRRSRPVGPLADAGRQGAGPLDALRRQRARAGPRPSGRDFGPPPAASCPPRPPWASSAACSTRPMASRLAGRPISAGPASASCPARPTRRSRIADKEPLPSWTADSSCRKASGWGG